MGFFLDHLDKINEFVKKDNPEKNKDEVARDSVLIHKFIEQEFRLGNIDLKNKELKEFLVKR